MRQRGETPRSCGRRVCVLYLWLRVAPMDLFIGNGSGRNPGTAAPAAFGGVVGLTRERWQKKKRGA